MLNTILIWIKQVNLDLIILGYLVFSVAGLQHWYALIFFYGFLIELIGQEIHFNILYVYIQGKSLCDIITLIYIYLSPQVNVESGN